MICEHQVVIKGREKDLANIDIATELSSFYRFFCNYGKIVDFNLEFLPNMIYITYKNKKSVQKIIETPTIEYINKSGITCTFTVNLNDFPLFVRNIKDPNQTYENFLPRRQQVMVNATYNPLLNNYSKHGGGPTGMFSLLNNNLVGSIDPSVIPGNGLNSGMGASSFNYFNQK